jgi:hypothetical protein
MSSDAPRDSVTCSLFIIDISSLVKLSANLALIERNGETIIPVVVVVASLSEFIEALFIDARHLFGSCQGCLVR